MGHWCWCWCEWHVHCSLTKAQTQWDTERKYRHVRFPFINDIYIFFTAIRTPVRQCAVFQTWTEYFDLASCQGDRQAYLYSE
jgi:hypothetical protein